METTRAARAAMYCRLRRHVAIDREHHAAAPDRHTLRRELLRYLRAGAAEIGDKTPKVRHRAGRKVMQHDQAPWNCTALIKRPLDPPGGIVPVARQAIP